MTKGFVFYVFGDTERGYLAYKIPAEFSEVKNEHYELIEEPNILNRIDTYTVDAEFIDLFYREIGLFPTEEFERINNKEEVDFWVGCYPRGKDQSYEVSVLYQKNGKFIGTYFKTWRYVVGILLALLYFPVVFFLLYRFLPDPW